MWIFKLVFLISIPYLCILKSSGDICIPFSKYFNLLHLHLHLFAKWHRLVSLSYQPWSGLLRPVSAVLFISLHPFPGHVFCIFCGFFPYAFWEFAHINTLLLLLLHMHIENLTKHNNFCMLHFHFLSAFQHFVFVFKILVCVALLFSGIAYVIVNFVCLFGGDGQHKSNKDNPCLAANICMLKGKGRRCKGCCGHRIVIYMLWIWVWSGNATVLKKNIQGV